ncbi:MAG: MBL fold metallo-hydrolase [Bacteroidetes bacterium]|nr:MBL fold metallo-hydrolase [Bacteroidota bacterium]
MLHIQGFTVNPFQENTYLLWDDARQCVIVDPGCLFPEEEELLADFIRTRGLTPVQLLNTHCHLDHVFGNAWVFDTYRLKPWLHVGELKVLQSMEQTARMYGIPALRPSPEPAGFLNPEQPLTVGTETLEMRLAPGHSPASLIFYHAASGQALVGDVIFQGSIGRYDLPGGSLETLMRSIYEQVLTLPEDTTLYPGHGQPTTVAHERATNPYLR